MNWLYNLIHGNCINQIDSLTNENSELKIKITELNKVINKEIVNEPSSKGTIGYTETQKILREKLDCYNVNLSDNYFNLTDKDTAKKYSSEAKVAYKQWIREGHDCDNFSFAAMGYWSQGLISFAFGIAWSNNHAFNIMVDNNKQIWIVEPQTNDYMTIEEAQKKSTPDGLSYFPIRLILM